MTFVRSMLLQLAGLVNTKDVNAWENGFLKSVLERTANGAHTSALSANQIEKVQTLWSKHFAG